MLHIQDGCSRRRKSRQAADQSGDEDSESSEEEGEDEDGMCGQLEEMLIKLVSLCVNLDHHFHTEKAWTKQERYGTESKEKASAHYHVADFCIVDHVIY
jgi:hypothetical protein